MHLLDGSRNSSTSRIADLLRDNAVIPATFSPDLVAKRLTGLFESLSRGFE
jgi:hypothetical protein